MTERIGPPQDDKREDVDPSDPQSLINDAARRIDAVTEGKSGELGALVARMRLQMARMQLAGKELRGEATEEDQALRKELTEGIALTGTMAEILRQNPNHFKTQKE